MSLIVEGIVLPVDTEDARPLVPEEFGEWEVVPVQNSGSFLVRVGRVVFSDHVDGIASALSEHVSETLVIRWDDRVGLRASNVYRQGKLVASYDASDELYVELADDGYPILDGPKFREDQLDESSDREYEVYRNALELACSELQWCRWETLKRAVLG